MALEAERLQRRVAPAWAWEMEGGQGTQRSSQSSTATTSSGSSLQAKSWLVPKGTS